MWNISTNIWSMGKRTGLKLREVSFQFIFYCLTVKTNFRRAFSIPTVVYCHLGHWMIWGPWFWLSVTNKGNQETEVTLQFRFVRLGDLLKINTRSRPGKKIQGYGKTLHTPGRDNAAEVRGTFHPDWNSEYWATVEGEGGTSPVEVCPTSNGPLNKELLERTVCKYEIVSPTPCNK